MLFTLINFAKILTNIRINSIKFEFIKVGVTNMSGMPIVLLSILIVLFTLNPIVIVKRLKKIQKIVGQRKVRIVFIIFYMQSIEEGIEERDDYILLYGALCDGIIEYLSVAFVVKL